MNDPNRFNRHTVMYMPPDLVFVRFHGDVSGPEGYEISTFFSEKLETATPVSSSTSPTSVRSARRRARNSRRAGTNPPRGPNRRSISRSSAPACGPKC